MGTGCKVMWASFGDNKVRDLRFFFHTI
jgi:hypothetical protein